SVAACGGDDDEGGNGSGGAAEGPGNGAAQAELEATLQKAREGIVEFEQPEPGSGDGLNLGFIALGDQVPFSKLVTDGMREAADQAGAELVVCDSRLDGQRALDCARNFKTQGVEGYLNFQVDQALSEAICKAGPDVPVIAVDITQEPCQVSFMGAANEFAGIIAGQAMGEFAKREWDCDYDAYVSLESTASVDANRARMGGYRKGFQSVCPGELKNERVLDADRTDAARTKMTDTLTALPGQKRIVVVAINDDGILGAIAAAKTAGREGDIYVSGQGADPSAWCEIKNNPNWVADAAYFPERYGEIGIPYLIRAVKGEEIPEDLLVPHELVNADNIDEHYEVTDC
ncbi:MAG: sugar ABC transporter substrate-binding protein, partial [Candidatus Limnocylindria bacterium]